MNPYGVVARRAAIVPLAFIALFLVFPVVALATEALDVDQIGSLWSNVGLRSVLWFTTWQATASTILTVLVAMPVTWVIARRRVTHWRLVRGLVTAPFLMPTIVVAVAVRSALPAEHATGLLPILVAHVLFNLAVVVRIVGPSWELLPEQRLESARVLGASPWQTFRSVVVPHVSGALIQAGSIVFVYCFTSYGVVTILGGTTRRTVEVEIVRRAIRIGDTGSAVALSLAQVVVIIVVVTLARPFSRSSAPQHPSNIAGRRGPGARLVAGVTVSAVLLPIAAIAVRSLRSDGRWSLRGWSALFDGSLRPLGVDVTGAIGNSVAFAVVCVAITVPIATVAATATVHAEGGTWIGGATLLPMAVSAVTLGFGTVVAFDTAPLDWRGQPWLIPVIHALVALPLVVRVLQPVFAGVDERQREAARVLGAGPWRTWLSIDLRQARPALVAGAGIAGAVSFGEFGATTFLARRGSSTLPLAIERLTGRAGDLPQQSACALAVAMALCVTVAATRA